MGTDGEPRGNGSRTLTVVGSSRRVPAGLFTAAAWAALRSGPVLAADPAHPQLPALRRAGIPVRVLTGDVAAGLAAVAAGTDPAVPLVWLADPPGPAGPAGDGPDPDGPGPAADVLAAAAGLAVELVPPPPDVAGSGLLDVVRVMDRLRSPGGCPWDAAQTHASLARYLLEEAYEAYEALETGDLAGLREEMGDVLLQVAFHARLGREDVPAWDVDDVASALVDKLVRRHPHVFGSAEVSGAAQVEAAWDVIKAAEKARTSVTEGVPMGQPALALAAALQSRARRAGLPAEDVTPEDVLAAVREAARDGGDEAFGDLLFAVVALAGGAGVDPEGALRGAARRFRDRLLSLEAARAGDDRP